MLVNEPELVGGVILVPDAAAQVVPQDEGLGYGKEISENRV